MNSLNFSPSNLTIVTGKGGCGKTLVSCGIALKSSREGLKTLIVEVFPPYSEIQKLFGLEGTRKGEVIPLSKNLYCVNYDFDDISPLFASLTGSDSHGGWSTIKKKLLSPAFLKKFLASIPGIAEIALLRELINLCSEYDKVIFDCFSTGHFLKLISSPSGITKIGITGFLEEQISKIKDFMNDDSRCGIVVCSAMDHWILDEFFSLVNDITSQGVCSISGLVLNNLKFSQETERQLRKASSNYKHSAIDADSESSRSRFLDYYSDMFANNEINIRSQEHDDAQKHLRLIEAKPYIFELPYLGAISEPLEPDVFKQLGFTS